jgi:hypothetical protein
MRKIIAILLTVVAIATAGPQGQGPIPPNTGDIVLDKAP